MGKQFKRIYYSIIGILVILLCYLNFDYRDVRLNFAVDSSVEYLNQWKYGTSLDDQQLITLPTEVDAHIDEPYEIITQLPESIDNSTYLCVKTDKQSLVVYIDDEKIYETPTTDQLSCSLTADYWNNIRLKNEYAGKNISLRFSCYNYSSLGSIAEVVYGTQAEIFVYIIEKKYMSFILALLLLLFGLLGCIIHYLLHNFTKNDLRLLYLSMISILLGIWLFVETNIFQVITDNFIITQLHYVALELLSFPIILFVDQMFRFRNNRMDRCLFYINMIHIIFIWSLMIFLDYNFSDTLLLTLSVIMIVVIALLIQMLCEIRNYKKRYLYPVFICFLLMTLSSLFEIYLYRNNNSNYIGIFSSFSIAFLLVLMLFYMVKQIKNIMVVREQMHHYEKLAYTDHLTKVLNRTAYHMRIQQLQYSRQRETVRLTVFDLNDLKMINDNYGHLVGDEALEKIAKCISGSFGDIGNTYRIGGDEFATIVGENMLTEYDRAIERLQERIRVEQQHLLYDFNIAYGYSDYNVNDQMSFEDVFRQADEMMYSNKSMMKKEIDNE